MYAVVYDLELVKRFKKGQLSEIVEIGACKVDLESRKITEQIQIYISPRSGYITKSTRSFINMKKEDMKKTVTFRSGIRKFVYWLGQDYFLCSWGKDDKVHLLQQCIRNHIPCHWFRNYNDIQKQIGKILSSGAKNQLGLKNALAMAGVEPVGLAHKGIDDALNTAELFIRYLDQIKLDMNSLTDKEIEYLENKRSRFHHNTSAQKPNIHQKVIRKSMNPET